MTYDPYADCPCGSGKKIKFCCHAVIADMRKVARLQENQPSRALQILDSLEAAHPANLWVASSHARLLMEQSDFAGAKGRCERFLGLEGNSRNAELTAIHALASFICDGFEAAKRSIHRAFQLCAKQEPAILTRLAGAIAMVMLEAESFMAARAHAALAVKLAPQEHRSHFVSQLAQLEGSSRIPYPLRSVHRLVPYTAAVEDEPDFQRAVKLASLGCWQPAGILFRRLADKHPAAPELWHNLGLCLAWDGNEPAAAEALHTAARLYTGNDHEAAVECETLAQLLDLELTEDVSEILLKSYRTDSVSRVLTALDAEDLFDRIDISHMQDDEDSPVAQYRLLDRPFPREIAPHDLNPDDVPEFVADILVFDGEGDEPAVVQVTGIEGEGFEQANEQLRSVLGDLIEEYEEGDNEPLGVVPTELADLEWNCHFPADFPATVARNIESRKMESVATDVWPDLPLQALGGKTPREAAGNDELNVALNAAVLVLDAFYDRNNVMLDIDAVRKALQLEPPAALSPGDSSVTAFSTVALQRIPIQDLSDTQLVDVARRAMLVRHTRTAYQVLKAAAQRQPCLEKLGAERVYSALVGICREQNLRDEALSWLAAGRESAAERPDAFQAVIEWDARELNLRLDDPTDSKIPALWERFEELYFPKLPELREAMADVMRQKGLGHLISEVAAVADGDTSVWTPGDPASDQPAKKLWVPGQE